MVILPNMAQYKHYTHFYLLECALIHLKRDNSINSDIIIDYCFVIPLYWDVGVKFVGLWLPNGS